MNDANVFDLMDTIVDISIEIRKKHKIKLPDGIIAATALAFNFILITRNAKDFQNIPKLKIIDPHSFDE